MGRVLEPGRDIDEADEASLVGLVAAARGGDPAARNEIFRLFGPRIDRWVWREWAFIRRRSTGVERGDLISEAFLVLADLIENWPGTDRFGVYIVHVFPLRLRSAARRVAGLPVRQRTDATDQGGRGVIPMDSGSAGPVGGEIADDSWEVEQSMVLLEGIVSRFPDERGQRILIWRVRDGQSFIQIARNLGLSRRQVHRLWNDIAAWARDNLAA